MTSDSPSRTRVFLPLHGFKRGAGVLFSSTGWNLCPSGTIPHGIVSSALGPDVFEVVTSGPIDGFDSLSVGSTYSLGSDSYLTASTSSPLAIAIKDDTLLVNFSLAATTSASAQTAYLLDLLNQYQLTSAKGSPNGYAPLNADGLVPVENLPTTSTATSAPRATPWFLA